jgi:hypothetical protein
MIDDFEQSGIDGNKLAIPHEMLACSDISMNIVVFDNLIFKRQREHLRLSSNKDPISI